jgi:SAM-dependent methyltransferase
MIKYSIPNFSTPRPPAPVMVNELIEYSVCPLCESKNFHLIRSTDCSKHQRYSPELSGVMHWNQCKDCAHVFRSGFYTDEALKIVFRGTNENQEVGYDLERQRVISAQMIEKVLPYQCSGGWLDVGFGNGSLLFTAHEYGFIPIGLDLRQQSVDALKKLGVAAFCMDIAKVELDEKVSVISMADVLEHMPFPKKGLTAAHRLLTDKGVLFISLPNISAPVWKALDGSNSNPYWGEVEHYHNFGRARLYSLLSEHGFTPVRYGISTRYRACMEVIAVKQ